ncbi:MAG: protein-glutamate O-methyltransferase CheR [Acidimicrobiaceae bacterium]|nr:protein-glutamate O-methyltransferase CheR [Acidimicrobiaceae bacterium]
MSLNQADFTYFAKFLHENSAIVVGSDKNYLLDSRLTPIQRRLGLHDLAALVQKLRTEPFGNLHREVIEAMTTNETYFFRDVKPFEALKADVLPEVIERNATKRTLNIWCAATASGQEPYSIQMLLKENFPQLSTWNVKIHCTDLSQEMVNRTTAGKYTQLEVNRGLPASLLIKHFEKNGIDWQVKSYLKTGIEARVMNLARPWPMMPKMDIVFMRNVLIYFDIETKRSIFNQLTRVMVPSGVLFLGGSETTLNLSNSFERKGGAGTSFYLMKSAASNAA